MQHANVLSAFERSREDSTSALRIERSAARLPLCLWPPVTPLTSDLTASISAQDEVTESSKYAPHIVRMNRRSRRMPATQSVAMLLIRILPWAAVRL